MSDAQHHIEQALSHIEAAQEEGVENEWVLRKAHQALCVELWSMDTDDD